MPRMRHKAFLYMSMLNTVESLFALNVKNTASGASTAVEISFPNSTVQLPSRAIFIPEFSKM